MNVNALNHLRNEHQNIISLLHILERQLNSIRIAQKPDYFLMQDITRYLTYYSDHYHHPFEDLIYTCLARKDIVYSTVVTKIENQHKEIAEKGNFLHEAICGLTRGSVLSRDSIFNYGIDYINQYRLHMQTEENELFEPVNTNLTTPDWLLLTSAFEWRPDPVLTEEVITEYQYLRGYITNEGAGEWPWSECLDNSCPVCSSAV